MSVMTGVKDYVQVLHQFVESSPSPNLTFYTELGSMLTYAWVLIKHVAMDVLSGQWLRQVWRLPLMVPDITSALVSEESIWDNYVQHHYTVLESPWSALMANKSILVQMVLKFSVGVLNSLFLIIPSSIAHVIIFRRFYVEGLQAGFAAGLGTVLGNVSWVACVVFGFRFILIPWLSLDWLRYLLGFVLLVQYLADISPTREARLRSERPRHNGWYLMLNFLLAWTEQVTIYPFLTNVSFGSNASMLESFPANSLGSFVAIHGSYVVGLLAGSLTLLFWVHWWWDNEASALHGWFYSLRKRFPTETTRDRLLRTFIGGFIHEPTVKLVCLYLTLMAAVSSFPYYALDYIILNPAGFVHPDRMLYRGLGTENRPTATGETDHPRVLGWFGIQPESYNTREFNNKQSRADIWKNRSNAMFRGLDTMLYDTGRYHLMPVEDLNYGYDKLWSRRKTTRRKVRYRIFPGPWMRGIKRIFGRRRAVDEGAARREFVTTIRGYTYNPTMHGFTRGTTRTVPDKRQIWLRVLADAKNNAQSSPGNSDAVVSTQQRRAFVRKFLRKTGDRLNQTQSGERPAQFQTFQNEKKQGIQRLMSPSHTWYDSGLSRAEMQRLRYAMLLDQPDKGTGVDHVLTLLTPLEQSLASQKALDRKWNFYRGKNARTLNPGDGSAYVQTGLQRILRRYRPNRRMYNTFDFRARLQNNKRRENGQLPARTVMKPSYAGQKQAKPNFFKGLMRRIPSALSPNTVETSEVPVQDVSRGVKSAVKKLTVPNEIGGTAGNTGTARRDGLTLALSPMKLDSNKVGPPMKWGSAAIDPNGWQANVARMRKPTHNYLRSSARVARYRRHIFRDCMNHWYHERPLRRLCMGLDIDAFMKRQPRNHRLSVQEEQWLHARRLLLREHYNSLRLYRTMQDYASMRERIGSTKSFASRAYQQQFQGTLRKIRHLFAITPAQSNVGLSKTQPEGKYAKYSDPYDTRNVLKFDQLLYNEYANTSTSPLVAQSWRHEELGRGGVRGPAKPSNPELASNVLRDRLPYVENNQWATLSDELYQPAKSQTVERLRLEARQGMRRLMSQHAMPRRQASGKGLRTKLSYKSFLDPTARFQKRVVRRLKTSARVLESGRSSLFFRKPRRRLSTVVEQKLNDRYAMLAILMAKLAQSTPATAIGETAKDTWTKNTRMIQDEWKTILAEDPELAQVLRKAREQEIAPRKRELNQRWQATQTETERKLKQQLREAFQRWESSLDPTQVSNWVDRPEESFSKYMAEDVRDQKSQNARQKVRVEQQRKRREQQQSLADEQSKVEKEASSSTGLPASIRSPNSLGTAVKDVKLFYVSALSLGYNAVSIPVSAVATAYAWLSDGITGMVAGLGAVMGRSSVQAHGFQKASKRTTALKDEMDELTQKRERHKKRKKFLPKANQAPMPLTDEQKEGMEPEEIEAANKAYEAQEAAYRKKLLGKAKAREAYYGNDLTTLRAIREERKISELMALENELDMVEETEEDRIISRREIKDLERIKTERLEDYYRHLDPERQKETMRAIGDSTYLDALESMLIATVPTDLDYHMVKTALNERVEDMVSQAGPEKRPALSRFVKEELPFVMRYLENNLLRGDTDHDEKPLGMHYYVPFDINELPADVAIRLIALQQLESDAYTPQQVALLTGLFYRGLASTEEDDEQGNPGYDKRRFGLNYGFLLGRRTRKKTQPRALNLVRSTTRQKGKEHKTMAGRRRGQTRYVSNDPYAELTTGPLRFKSGLKGEAVERMSATEWVKQQRAKANETQKEMKEADADLTRSQRLAKKLRRWGLMYLDQLPLDETDQDAMYLFKALKEYHQFRSVPKDLELLMESWPLLGSDTKGSVDVPSLDRMAVTEDRLARWDKQQRLRQWFWSEVLPSWRNVVQLSTTTLSPPMLEAQESELDLLRKIRSRNSLPVPFYAGWDESLRKFVVTNRLANPSTSMQSLEEVHPIRGLNFMAVGWNESTRWRVPFLSYDSLQQQKKLASLLTPLNWRRFKFRHTLVQAWRAKQREQNWQNVTDKEGGYQNTVRQSGYQWLLDNPGASVSLSAYAKSRERKLQQRWVMSKHFVIRPDKVEKFKQHKFHRAPRPALAQQVLPLHFLQAFDQRPFDSRTRRARYVMPGKSMYKGVGLLGRADMSTQRPAVDAQGERVKPFRRKAKRVPFTRQYLEQAAALRDELDDWHQEWDKGLTFRRRPMNKRQKHRRVNKHNVHVDFEKRKLSVKKRKRRGKPQASPIRQERADPQASYKAWSPRRTTRKKVKPAKTERTERLAEKSKRQESRRARKASKLDKRPGYAYQRRSMAPLPGGFMWPGHYPMLYPVQKGDLSLKYLQMDDPTAFPKVRRNPKWFKSRKAVKLADTSINRAVALKWTSLRGVSRSVDAQRVLKPKPTAQYLAERHNIQAVKKRLKKAARTNQLPVDLARLERMPEELDDLSEME